MLKDWLVRALTGVFRRNGTVLTIRDLQAHALSVPQCEKMLSEALEGEVTLLEGAQESNRLRTRLGLNPIERPPEKLASMVDAGIAVRSRKQRWRPGQRIPTRDVIGRVNANAVNL